jgi:DNA-binding response OmpR family regulator
MKMLVVDGDAKTRDRLAKMLGEAGHEVLTARNGADGFHAYEDNTVDMAFIDWAMDDMSGTELCRIVRDYNLKTGRKSYVILTSPRSEMNDMVAGLDAGADDFLLKPYSKSVVISRVEVGERVLETKVNRLPKVRPLGERVIEPVAVLNREHLMVRKVAALLEVAANMLGEGRPVPKRLLTWAASSAIMLDWQLHEEKEMFYIDLFIERAREVHGKTAQLYSRSSLSKILKEHDAIRDTLARMQLAAEAYTMNDERTASRLRGAILRYVPLIRFHAAREEDVFLPFSQRYLTDDDAARIMKDFARVDGEVGSSAVERRIRELEKMERAMEIGERAA